MALNDKLNNDLAKTYESSLEESREFDSLEKSQDCFIMSRSATDEDSKSQPYSQAFLTRTPVQKPATPGSSKDQMRNAMRTLDRSQLIPSVRETGPLENHAGARSAHRRSLSKTPQSKHQIGELTEKRALTA